MKIGGNSFMIPHLKSKPWGLRLLIAALLAVLAAWLRFDVLSGLAGVPYITAYPAVTLAALYGGLISGLAATLLSALLVSWFWLTPLGSLQINTPSELLGMFVFIGSGGLISAMAETMHRAEARARSEAAQRASEERYRRLFAAIPDPVVILRLEDRRYQEVNEAFLEFLEIPRERVIGRTCEEVDIWADDGDISLHVDALQKSGENLRNHEVRLKTGSGRIRTVLLSVDLFELGGAQYALSSLKDITERKHAEEALRESEARLDLALDSGGMGMWEWDPRNNVSRWNAKEYELLGLPAGDSVVPTSMFFERMHPDDLPAFNNGLEKLLRDGSSWQDECRIIRPDGTQRWIAGVGRLQRDPAGQPLRMIGVNYDITDRKQAEENLLESEKRFRELFDLCPVPLGFVHRDGRILDLNVRFTRMFGYTLTDIPTLTQWRERAYPDPAYRQAVIRNWDAALSADAPEQADIPTAEYQVTCKNGETRTVLISGMSARGGILTSIFDITHLKLLEERLKQSKEEADSANRAKSRFLATMSHEIRTPLSGLLGMTELAMLEDIPEQARQYLFLAKQSGARLLGIINDILDLSKIESGKTRLKRQPFSLAECIRATLAPMSELAKTKGVALYHAVGESLPDALVGDQGRLQQIITNLVGNALKFTPAGGDIWLTVGLDRQQPEAGAVRLLFTVRDSGRGIEPGRLGEVFDAFNQAGLEAGTAYGGTGLGLSISKSLVEMMDGRIWAESEPGKGSSFSFTIRLDLAPEPPPGRTPKDGTRLPPEAEQSLRLLVAEDDPVNQDVAVRYLQRKGHAVTAVENGQQALEALGREPFDAVLMDVWMPLLDGLEATRRIRGRTVPGVNHRIPIIATTAFALVGDRERFLAAGMDYYLAKPLDMQELEAILKDIAAKTAAEPTAAGTAPGE